MLARNAGQACAWEPSGIGLLRCSIKCRDNRWPVSTHPVAHVLELALISKPRNQAWTLPAEPVLGCCS